MSSRDIWTYCKEFASTFGVPSFLQSSLYLFGAWPIDCEEQMFYLLVRGGSSTSNLVEPSRTTSVQR